VDYRHCLRLRKVLLMDYRHYLHLMKVLSMDYYHYLHLRTVLLMDYCHCLRLRKVLLMERLRDYCHQHHRKEPRTECLKEMGKDLLETECQAVGSIAAKAGKSII
jgi:hypothetical protein